MIWTLFTFWIACITQIQTVLAWKTIAHRGVSRDVNDRYALAESCSEAMQRAAQFGLSGVEFDIQMTRDGVPVVAHDRHGARETIQDGLGGLSNPIDVALETQSPGKLVNYSELPYSFWNHILLKVYGRGGRLLPSTQRLESVEDMLQHLKDLQKPDFQIFLDIQSPETFRASAALIKKHNLER